MLDTVQRNVDAIRRAGGTPHVNHPNFGWAITADELRQVERYKLFEIYNVDHARQCHLWFGRSLGPIGTRMGA